MNLFKLIQILLIIPVLFSCNPQPAEDNAKAKSETQTTEGEILRDGIFIHLSSGIEDPHKVAMALQMAVLMSEDKNVLLYCDINAVDIVLKDSPNIEFRQFPGSQLQLEKLFEKGVNVMACPGCLQAAGKTSEDLMTGVKLADKDAFFNFTDGKILSISY